MSVKVAKEAKVAKVAKMVGKTNGRRAVSRKEATGKRKVARETPEHVGRVARQGHIAARCRKGGNNNLYSIDEDESENFEEATDTEEDLQAWCL